MNVFIILASENHLFLISEDIYDKNELNKQTLRAFEELFTFNLIMLVTCYKVV